MTGNRPEAGRRADRAFFGRRRGRRLHPGRQRLVDKRLPALRVDLGAAPLDAKGLFGQARRLFLEIGFGGGEHLARRAAADPNAGFVGAEPFVEGVGKLIALIEQMGLRNIRIFDDDALILLKAMADASLDGVDLIFPDPWPKTRHHKRRFVSPPTLAELARAMKPGAAWRFATDVEDYADWTLAHLLRDRRFAWSPARPGGWRQPWPDYVPTRYERKTRRARAPFYFTFTRAGAVP